MSMTFFNSVLATLGKRVNYDAIINYAGNSFAKDSWKMIQEANPLLKNGGRRNHAMADLFASANIAVAKSVTEAVTPGHAWFNLNEERVGDITN